MRILLRFSPDFVCVSESDRTCLTTLRQTVALDALNDFYLIYTPVSFGLMGTTEYKECKDLSSCQVVYVHSQQNASNSAPKHQTLPDLWLVCHKEFPPQATIFFVTCTSWWHSLCFPFHYILRRNAYITSDLFYLVDVQVSYSSFTTRGHICWTELQWYALQTLLNDAHLQPWFSRGLLQVPWHWPQLQSLTFNKKYPIPW